MNTNDALPLSYRLYVFIVVKLSFNFELGSRYFWSTSQYQFVICNCVPVLFVCRCEPPRSRSANSSKHRRKHGDDELVYRCLYLVHRVRKPIIYGKGYN